MIMQRRKTRSLLPASRAGSASAGAYVVYQAPGKSLSVTQQVTDPTSDPYLELFELTTPNETRLIGFDDDAGGGFTGKDARVTLAPVSVGRFVEIRGFIVGPGQTLFTLVIQ